MKKTLAIILTAAILLLLCLSGCEKKIPAPNLPENSASSQTSSAAPSSSEPASSSEAPSSSEAASSSEAEPSSETEPSSEAEPSSEPASSVQPEPVLEEGRVCRFVYLMLDPAAATLDGYSVADVEGNWTMDIHLCNSEEQVEKYRGYYEGTLASDKNTDLVAEEKTYGAYTFQTEHHVANGQKFGTFFVEFDEPVVLPNDYGTYNAIYCYLWMEDESSMDVMGEIIGSLKFDFREEDM